MRRLWEYAKLRVCATAGLLFLLNAGAAAAQTMPATVILVRHAERAAEPKDDPPLSDAGLERVKALEKALHETGVSVVYSTDRRRNLETARPIGQAFGVPVVELKIEGAKIDAWARDVAARIRKDGGGRITLVVGHSNTFAPVIKALGGPDIEEIADDRYDDMFVLIVQEGTPTRLIRGKYGKRWGD